MPNEASSERLDLLLVLLDQGAESGSQLKLRLNSLGVDRTASEANPASLRTVHHGMDETPGTSNSSQICIEAVLQT